MPRFIWDEPEAFCDEKVFIHHETGHLLLSYFFGFPIGRLKYRQAAPGVIAASIKSTINPDLERETPELAYTAKSIQLLAGELAGRRYAKLPLDEVCVALRGPTRVDERTGYDELILPTDHMRNRDEIRVLDYVKGVRAQVRWWEWFWTQHAEAGRVLSENWGVVLEVAKHILTIDPYMNDEEKRRGSPSRRIEGDVLIGWLREQNALVKDPRYTSVHYQTDD